MTMYKIIVFSIVILIILSSSGILLLNQDIDKDHHHLFQTTKNFPYLKPLEDQWKTIKQEIPYFDPNKKYMSRDHDAWDNDKGKELFEKIKDNPEWIKGWMKQVEWYNYPLIYIGEPMAQSDKICPKTYKLLKSIPQIKIAGYAILKSGYELEKHVDSAGYLNNAMAGNMQLTGGKATLSVQNKFGIFRQHRHKHGKLVIFDSTNKHFASNNDKIDRVILYIEFGTNTNNID